MLVAMAMAMEMEIAMGMAQHLVITRCCLMST